MADATHGAGLRMNTTQMVIVLAAALLWLVANEPASAESQELLVNGGFEAGGQCWQEVGCTFGLTDETGFVRTGGMAATVADDDEVGWVYQVVRVQPGGDYTLGGWAMKNDADVRAVFVRIRWYETEDGSGVHQYTIASERLTGDVEQYQRVTVDDTAPGDARSARIECVIELVDSPAGTGTAYFDDVSFSGPPPSTPTAVAVPTPTPTAATTPAASATPTPSAQPTPSPTPVAQPTPTATPALGTPLAPTPTPVPAASPNPTPTPGPTPTPVPTPGGTSAGRGDIVVNEVMYDPLPDGSPERQLEWLEMFNPTGHAVDIEGWTVTDNWETDVIPSLTVPSGGFAVVAATESCVSDFTSLDGAVVVIEDGSIGNGLANDGDHLTLKDSAGNVIDELSYGDDASRTPRCPDVDEGHSLERSPPGGEFVDNPGPSPGRGLFGLSTPAASPTATPPTTPTSGAAAGSETTPDATPAVGPTPQPAAGMTSSGTALRAVVIAAAIACVGIGLLLRARRRK